MPMKRTVLIKHNAQIQSLFETYDTDKSGTLSADQIMPLLEKVAVDDNVEGATRFNTALDGYQSIVTQADVDFVLAQCDSDGSGSISFDELGPALATWKEACKGDEIRPPSKSSACVLL